ncbi:MAG TPA: DUF2842 domain-containing protein [Hyphomicrobiales bacterium]|nr:DUF2842 domain-containing protein [Rhodobiaceae bacterium]HXK53152.1 DUF2842 domain-containing protein [Hyphomicrobiales bacterium]
MPARIRKLVGSIGLLVFVAAYALGAGLLGAVMLDGSARLLQTAYYIAAGFLWIFPAALFIRWMQKPD